MTADARVSRRLGSRFRAERVECDSGARAVFSWKTEEAGKYEVRLAYLPHENRGKSVKVGIMIGDQKKIVLIDMTKKPDLQNSLISLGDFEIENGKLCQVVVETAGSKGIVHIDAIQILPANSDR